MKTVCLLCFCLGFMPLLRAQQLDGFSAVDSKALSIPAAETNSTAAIALWLNKHFSTQEEKCRAAYRWVTANIFYDTDSMYAINAGSNPQTKITAALRRRKGVCENYSAIFNDILVKSGLVSYVVNGYTKQAGRVNKSGHSWCAVYLDGEWLLCDPTWDEGFRGAAKYFLVPPSTFITAHMPFDPIWQLSNQPISPYEFSHNLSHNRQLEGVYNYLDSINVFTKLDSISQVRTTAERMQRAGVETELIRIRLAYLNMIVGINDEDKDMEFYNSAIKDLNDATIIFNRFVGYRNQRFFPVRADEEIKGLLEPADDMLLAAVQKLDIIAVSPAPLELDTDDLRSKLTGMMAKLQDQKNFLQLYLRSDPDGRVKLFYTNQQKMP